MFNMGASDAIKFVEAAEEMTRRAKDLGPNPVRNQIIGA